MNICWKLCFPKSPSVQFHSPMPKTCLLLYRGTSPSEFQTPKLPQHPQCGHKAMPSGRQGFPRNLGTKSSMQRVLLRSFLFGVTVYLLSLALPHPQPSGQLTAYPTQKNKQTRKGKSRSSEEWVGRPRWARLVDTSTSTSSSRGQALSTKMSQHTIDLKLT